MTKYHIERSCAGGTVQIAFDPYVESLRFTVQRLSHLGLPVGKKRPIITNSLKVARARLALLNGSTMESQLPHIMDEQIRACSACVGKASHASCELRLKRRA